VEEIRKTSFIKREEAVAAHQKEIEKSERRISELDVLFRKTYEDNVAGELTDDRFAYLSASYDSEQSEIRALSEKLKSELHAFNADSLKIDKFLELAQRYTVYDELTTTMLNEFVDKVLVFNADKSSGVRSQRLDIYLSFIGKFYVPVSSEQLSQEELAAEEWRLLKKRKQQDYFRRRYYERKQKQGDRQRNDYVAEARFAS